MIDALYIPIIVGHNVFLEPTLDFLMRTNVGHNNYFPRKFMWGWLLYFVLFVLYN
jgi:hypothetical protein